MGLIIVRQAQCTGCLLCESICAVSHERQVSVARARLQIVKNGLDGSPSISICRRCKKCAPGEKCPTLAIKRDAAGVISFDKATCDLCGQCAPLCPFGAIRQVEGAMIACDLCGGEPECVRFCAAGAISID